MPKLSVIVVVYNLEKYIRECLDSVLNQGIEDYEVVLVDNSSTDHSREICREYEKKYSEIRYFPLDGENVLGRGHSVGIAEAKGQYIHIIDGDDYIAPGCYKDIMKIIYEEAPDIIMGSFISVPEEGAKHFKDTQFQSDRINGRKYEEAIDYLMKLPNFHLTFWRYIWKKDVFNTRLVDSEDICELYAKMNRISYHGDMISAVRILCKANSIYYYDKPFYYYRIRKKGSISSDKNFKHYRGYFLVIYKLLEMSIDFRFDGIRKEFVYHMIIKTFRLFSSGIGIIDDNGIREIAEIINDNPEYLNLLREIKDKDIKKFCRCIEIQGAYNGIKEYFDYKIKKIMSYVMDNKDDNIYIFPSGRYGEFFARILIKNEVNVKGFLDNDLCKHDTSIMGLNCFFRLFEKQ